MSRAWNNLHRLLASELFERFLVHLDDRTVVAANNEKSGRFYPMKNFHREVRTASARDDRFNRWIACGGDQSSGGAGARAEVSYRMFRVARPRTEPSGRIDKPMAEKIDIEDVLAIRGLVIGEKIEEQGTDAGFLQRLRNVCIAWAQPAAAASMRE